MKLDGVLGFPGNAANLGLDNNVTKFPLNSPDLQRLINTPIGVPGDGGASHLSNYIFIVTHPCNWEVPGAIFMRDFDSSRDVKMDNERQTLRELFRRINVPTSQIREIPSQEAFPDISDKGVYFKRVLDSDKNPNIRGPLNQKAEIIEVRFPDGKVREYNHHKYGHIFKDRTPPEYNYPHYHEPNNEHIIYQPGPNFK